MSNNPIRPFWSWNDKLEKEELEAQIEAMKKAGIEGFFMHARGGLITEYMGEDWMNMIECCLYKADELGMQAWAYDENGWPSGFADGIVPSKGFDFQQKWLECKILESIDELPQNILGCFKIGESEAQLLSQPEVGCAVIYIGVNIYYIDTFNSAAIRCFLDNVHERYYEKFSERFGSSLKGFFTDEPQYGNGFKAPWSGVFADYFAEKYGEELIPQLPCLFYDLKGAKAFRAKFYNMVGELFRSSFMKQMYDWCSEHNCRLTGHMMNEQCLADQMSSTGGVMSCYEYFHEPGVDWLCRCIASPLVPKQLGSAAYQLGRKTLTESFALCGWDVSLNELKWIAQWQFVNGVTGLCPHLEGYTLRGCRKRDYPASLFTQLPWFEDAYPAFSDYAVSLGELLDSGRDIAPLLVIHPMQSAYVEYNPLNLDALRKYDARAIQLLDSIAGEHILHHYGDECFMENNSAVENGELKVGLCSYKAVLLPELINIKSSTAALLNAFAEAGGSIYALGFAPSFADGERTAELEALKEKIHIISDIAELKNADWAECASITVGGEESPDIHYCKKQLEDGRELYYLVNLSKQPKSVNLELAGDVILKEKDVVSGEESVACCAYNGGKTSATLEFAEYGSYVLTAEGGALAKPACGASENIPLFSDFEISACDDNCFTLDYCEYSINGGDWQEKLPVMSLQKLLLERQCDCDIAMRFSFEVEKGAEIGSMKLCCENPENFIFEINGRPFDFKDIGYFTDKSFRKCDISAFVREGENAMVLKGKFHQNSNVYRVLFTPGVHEVERNKLTYDTELESVYLIGDFGVKSKNEYTLGERKALFTGREFALISRPDRVDASNITASGYPFFAGKMSLKQRVFVDKKADVKYNVSLSKLYCPAAELYVNGKRAGIFAFAPYTVEVTGLIENGENELEIRLLSGNRNLLGPHHRACGEVYSVSPGSFVDEGPDWAAEAGDHWTDDYSFVLFGLEG